MAGGVESDQVLAHDGIERSFYCCFYGAGIIVTLLVYGLLQERIMTLPYGEDQFAISAFLVFSNRVCAVCYSFAWCKWSGTPVALVAPAWKYFSVSLSNVCATWCQYEALLYVSFPVQMLGKSFKMMPVMLWGILISGKTYRLRDWLIAAAVTGGVTEFLMTGPTASSSTTGNSMYGFFLLLCFLAFDGFTSNMQEKLFKEYETISKPNQMFWVNVFSSIISFLILIFTADLIPTVEFIQKHPLLLRDSTILSASAVAGQYFIYAQVHEFGALVFAASMNVRQVVSIIVSYATYGTAITGLQILGLFIVFGALFYKSYLGLMIQKGEPDEKTPINGGKKAAEGASS